jgi:hypothetical protein
MDMFIGLLLISIVVCTSVIKPIIIIVNLVLIAKRKQFSTLIAVNVSMGIAIALVLGVPMGLMKVAMPEDVVGFEKAYTSMLNGGKEKE